MTIESICDSSPESGVDVVIALSKDCMCHLSTRLTENRIALQALSIGQYNDQSGKFSE